MQAKAERVRARHHRSWHFGQFFPPLRLSLLRRIRVIAETLAHVPVAFAYGFIEAPFVIGIGLSIVIIALFLLSLARRG